MKIIRIKGLIAFVVVSALIFGAWTLLVDGAVKKLIESGGTSIVGSKVELQKADLSISPLGLTLKGLDITDPDNPMVNMIHVDKISFLMAFERLLLGKVIINEMLIDGVKTGTPRKISGAIRKEKRESKDKDAAKGFSTAFSMPSLDVPNIDDILTKEKLQSLEQIDALKAALEKKEEEWKLKLEELPDDKKMDDYKKRIRTLKKGLKGKGAAVLVAIKNASRLQKDIKKDLRNLKRARKALKSDLKGIEADIKGVEKLPEKDFQRLKAKYTLSSGGLGNISKLLFAGKIAEWTDLILNGYRKVEPSLKSAGPEEKKDKKPARAGGMNIKFREYKRKPDFLVKIARVTLDVPAGLLKGEIRNITDNQPLVGSPTSLLFTGKKLKGLDSTEIKGEVNRLDPENPYEKGSIKTKGYKLEEVILSSSRDFPVQIKSAYMDGDFTFVKKKESLNGNFTGNFKETVFAGEVQKKKSSDLASLLLSSLSDMKAFNVKGSVSSMEGEYHVKVKSNIDRVVKKAIGKRVEKESRRFAKELKRQIAKKVSKPLDALKKAGGGLGDLDKILEGNLKDLESQLKSSKKLSSKGLKFKF